jgi:hypothetical protein
MVSGREWLLPEAGLFSLREDQREGKSLACLTKEDTSAKPSAAFWLSEMIKQD